LENNISTKEEKNTFSQMIETRALSQNIRRMEAIIDYCEETGLELEIAATLLNPNLKIKIETEAKKLKFIKK
jgi:hypothetical protein